MIDKQDDENRDIRNISKEKLLDLLRMTHEEGIPDTADTETESSPAPKSPDADQEN